MEQNNKQIGKIEKYTSGKYALFLLLKKLWNLFLSKTVYRLFKKWHYIQLNMHLPSSTSSDEHSIFQLIKAGCDMTIYKAHHSNSLMAGVCKSLCSLGRWQASSVKGTRWGLGDVRELHFAHQSWL